MEELKLDPTPNQIQINTQQQQANVTRVRLLHRGLVLRSGKLSGEQSIVFLVRKIGEMHDNILKIVQRDNFKSYQQEKNALLEIEKHDLCKFGFPKMISFMECDDHVEMVIEACGNNLRNLQKDLKPTGNFSKPTSYKIAIQLLDCLEKLHSIQFVHNDIKLENIVVGAEDLSKIYLIDFGLTHKFVDENGFHNKKTYIKNFSGNFLFASLNSCRGFNKSRRDDVESLFYLLIFLLNDQYLPWCDILKEQNDKPKPELKVMLKERLELKYTKKLFNLVPRELNDCLKYVLSLQFDELPNYEYIKEQFVNSAAKLIKQANIDFQSMSNEELINNHDFEWIDQFRLSRKKQVLQNNGKIQPRQIQESQKDLIVNLANKKNCSQRNIQSLVANSLKLKNSDSVGMNSQESERLGSLKLGSCKLRQDINGQNILASHKSSCSLMSNSSLGSIQEQMNDWEDDDVNQDIQQQDCKVSFESNKEESKEQKLDYSKPKQYQMSDEVRLSCAKITPLTYQNQSFKEDISQETDEGCTAALNINDHVFFTKSNKISSLSRRK